MNEHQYEWLDEARCKGADTDLFFPEQYGSNTVAKAICEGCDVRVECLQYALDNHERYGVWGGVSERERRRINRLGMTATEYIQGLDDGTITPPTRGRPARQAV